jgi:hypothetical protein
LTIESQSEGESLEMR